MAILAPVQTFWASSVAGIGETARLARIWRSTSGGGVPMLSIHNSGQDLSSAMDLISALTLKAAASRT